MVIASLRLKIPIEAAPPINTPIPVFFMAFERAVARASCKTFIESMSPLLVAVDDIAL